MANKKMAEFGPEEIRALRKQLGLTQAEAGELLGGGPRAFSKYENGTVKPAASVINLLRLLERNPSAIAELNGGRARPMQVGPDIGPFEVTSRHIEALGEREFPPLLRRLLRMEAEAHDLPGATVHVADNIHQPDGGEDGRIRWTGDPERTNFLPRRLVQFQLKAGKIRPAQARREVLASSGAVKEMVRSVLQAGGTYVLLCARTYTQREIGKREAAMLDSLRAAGMSLDDDQIRFRDASQIADWANAHPAVAIWVKEQTQPGAIGPFRSWLHWAGRAEHEKAPYVEDERLAPLRTRLLEQATQPHGILRVVGLSGVGKSRLVLEALDCGDQEERSFADIVLHADDGEDDPVAVNSAVQALAEMRTRVVLVVEHCSPEHHRALDGFVSRSGSRLSLITIDDEIPSGTPDADTYPIPEAPIAVVEGIIDRLSPGLPCEDRYRLTAFSNGFPEFAIGLVRGWAASTPLAHITEDDLVETFVLGRRPRNREALLKTAELLAAFPLINLEDSDQLHEVAGLGCNLSSGDLRESIIDLVNRGVARRRGRLVTLEPRPVALKFAERRWRSWSRDRWESILAGDSWLAVAAAGQLALLNTTDVSRKVVRHVCRHRGLFDNPGSAPTAAKVLFHLAQVDPLAAANQIERFLDNCPDESNLDDHLVWALEKIAFRKDGFECAALLLLRLAVSKNSIKKRARDKFASLFNVHVGATEADGERRLDILEEASETDNKDRRAVVVEALSAGLESRHAFRMGGAETHGTRPAMQSWRPATAAEWRRYVEVCVERLAGFAERQDETGIIARRELGRHLRSLVAEGFVEAVEKAVGLAGRTGPVWAEALEGLGYFLEYDVDDEENDLIDRVNRLISDLRPNDLPARISYLVTELPWYYPVGERLDVHTRISRQTEDVRTLAIESSAKPEVLAQMLPQLSRGKQRMAAEFGRGLAAAVASPLDWLEQIAQAVAAAPEQERNFDLLSGYVAGLAADRADAAEEFKRTAARSPDLAPALPPICWRIGIAPSDIALVMATLEAELLGPLDLTLWIADGVLAKLPEPEVAPLFDALVHHSAEGFAVAVGLLGMYVHGELDRLENLRPQLLKVVDCLADYVQSLRGLMTASHFENIIQWLLEKGRQDRDACAAALGLAGAFVKAVESRTDWFISPVLPVLLSGFPEIAWPLIGEVIVSGESWRYRRAFGKIPSRNEARAVILNLPEDSLFAWCRAHPDKAPVFAAEVLPVLVSREVDVPEIHPVTARLIDEFGDRKEVLEAVAGNLLSFSNVGSRAAHYERYKVPIKALQEHGKRQVRRWSRDLLDVLDEQGKIDRDRDAEFAGLRQL